MQILEQETYDCEPTLTDSQVLEFCKTGYLMFEGVVPDEINRKTIEYCDRYPVPEPQGIVHEDWFVENVIVNPTVGGVLRSLLGADFHLPIKMANHRVHCPMTSEKEAQEFPVMGGVWHVDGNYCYTPELNFLQVFYYPQDTPLEMGPTQIVPGSHLIRNKGKFMFHLDGIRGAIPTTAPAGSIFITIYHIWHRRGPSTASGIRNLLKYFARPRQSGIGLLSRNSILLQPITPGVPPEITVTSSCSAMLLRWLKCSYGFAVGTNRFRIWVDRVGP